MMHDGDNLPSSTIAEEADITRPMADMVYIGLAWFTDYLAWGESRGCH